MKIKMPIGLLGSILALVSIAESQTLKMYQKGSAGLQYFDLAKVDSIVFVEKKPQMITFPAIGNRFTGDPAVVLAASASSGLSVSYQVTTPSVCALSGNSLLLNAAGLCSVTASQVGDWDWNAAADVSQSLTISKKDQLITFPAIADRTLQAGSFNPSAVSTSGLPIVYVSQTPSVCTASGATITPVSSGICSVTASQPGSAVYNAALNVTQSFNVRDLYANCLSVGSNLVTNCGWWRNESSDGSQTTTSDGKVYKGSGIDVLPLAIDGSLEVSAFIASVSGWVSYQNLSGRAVDVTGKSIKITYSSNAKTRVNFLQSDWDVTNCGGAQYIYPLPSTNGLLTTVVIPVTQWTQQASWVTGTCIRPINWKTFSGVNFSNDVGGPITINLKVSEVVIQ